MKTEQILAAVTAAAAHLQADEKRLYDYTVARGLKEGTFGALGDILGALTVKLREDLRIEEAKRTGRSSQLRAMERIAQNRQGVKPSFADGTFCSADGARAVCDGYRAVRITRETVTMPAESKSKEANPMNVLTSYAPESILSPAVNLPEIPELRAMIRESRGKYHGRPGKKNTFLTVYRLDGEDGQAVYVNGDYLLDMLEALPGALVKVNSSHRTAQFYNEDGDGVLMGLKESGLTGPGVFQLNFLYERSEA